MLIRPKITNKIINEKPINLLDEQGFEANQHSEMTPTQKEQAQATIGWAYIIFVIVLVVLFGIYYALLLGPIIFAINADNFFVIPLRLFLGGIFLIFLFLVGRDLFKRARKTILIRHDIANHAIHQGHGQIVHTKKGYVFEMDGNARPLHLNANLNNGLLPGVTYKVYYLEKSRFLLSARATQAPNPSLIQVVLNDILATANGFSAEDLRANQNGQIVPAQYRRLIRNARWGVGFLLLPLLFILPFIAFPQALQTLTQSWGILAVLGIFLLIGLIMLVQPLLDVVTHKPQHIQGRVYKGKHFRRNGANTYSRYVYEYRINRQRFTVSRSAYTALIDGLHYRIYYLPHTKNLLSIETMLVPYTGSHVEQP